jgi:hypothetical protein
MGKTLVSGGHHLSMEFIPFVSVDFEILADDIAGKGSQLLG